MNQPGDPFDADGLPQGSPELLPVGAKLGIVTAFGLLIPVIGYVL